MLETGTDWMEAGASTRTSTERPGGGRKSADNERIAVLSAAAGGGKEGGAATGSPVAVGYA